VAAQGSEGWAHALWDKHCNMGQCLCEESMVYSLELLELLIWWQKKKPLIGIPIFQILHQSF